MKTRTWLILGGAVIGAIVIWLALVKLFAAVEVEAARVKTGKIREFVDERAKTRLPQIHRITMPYNGRIRPIKLSEGARVNLGDPVAQVVTADLELALAQAQAALGQADASVTENADVTVEQTAVKQALKYVQATKASTEATAWQVQAAKDSLQYANSDLARTRRAYRTGASSDEELELAELRQRQRAAEYQQALKTHLSAQFLDVATELMPLLIRQYITRKGLTGNVLKQQTLQANARLKQAKLDSQRGTMTSPIDGVVLARHVTNERLVPAGNVLLEIGRLEDLEVEADVLSLDVVSVREGDSVEIYGPAIGKRGADGKHHAQGKVHEIYPAGFTKISSLGVEQQRVKVIVRIDPKDLKWLLQERKLGVDYRVRVRIITAEKSAVRIIPRSALFRDAQGKWQVYAIRSGRAKIQPVKVGLMNDQWVEITSGLADGEQVVLAPESNLADGARVQEKQKAALPAGNE